MTEWEEVTVGDFLQVRHGFAFKGEYFTDDGDLVVLTPGNFHDAGGFKEKSGKEKYYSGPVPDGYLLEKGHVVVAMTEQSHGLLGSTATIPNDGHYLHNQRLGLLRVTDPTRLDLRFCYHAMNGLSVRQQIQATATGSKVRHTAPERIRALRIRLPDIETQRLVAGILDTLDDLVENNRRRIEVLERMAQAIFREWFVRFRYPGHADATFVDSPLGPIPEGWEVRPLQELATVMRGRSYRKAELVETDGVPFVNLKCMRRGGGFRRDGLKRYDGKHNPEQHVREGDIVLAVTDLTQGREILARATLVPRLAEDFGVISLDVVRLVPLDVRDRLALLFALLCTDFPDRVKELANGSTVLHLSPTHVAEGLVLWPAERPRRTFVEAVEPLIAETNELSDGADCLTVLRDVLLPKLVTGQIDVSHLDLDAVVEAVR